ncbi:hypothetical protein IW148_003169 [Coemansia sp. RSA 1199]|nr:hypothetical protein IW148_003169 [Coemansia sp. RSA 1199]
MAYSTNSGDIPKIQLESKEDVLFLERQFSDFLLGTLKNNSTLRNSSMTSAQRQEAESLVLDKLQMWTKDIWAMAGHSMSVNGFGYAEAMQEKSRIDPLDEALKSEVEALREEADALLLSVTNKRRTVPKQIERLVDDAVWRESVAAENTTEIEGLEETDTGDLPYIDDRVNGEFEHALRMASAVAEQAPHTADELRQLTDTLNDTKARAAIEAEDDRKVREILLPAKTTSLRNAPPASDKHQLLAYKAALHAISSD